MNNQSINNFHPSEEEIKNYSSGNESQNISSTLIQVFELATSDINPQIAFNKALERLLSLSAISRAAILLKPAKNNALRVFAWAGYSQNVRNMEIPLAEDNTGWVFSHQQPLRINQIGTSKSSSQSSRSAVLIVPVSYQGKHFGVIILENINKAFTNNDENFFRILGTFVGAILSNTDLQAEINKNDIMFSFYMNLVSKIHTMINKDEIIKLVSDEITQLLSAKKVQITIGSSEITQDTNYVDNAFRHGGTALETGDNRLVIPFYFDKGTQGMMLVERDALFSKLELKFIEAISVEVGSVLEKLTVMKDRQKSSTREKQISEVTSKIWASQTIDLILQTGIKEIGSALGADEATIRLN